MRGRGRLGQNQGVMRIEKLPGHRKYLWRFCFLNYDLYTPRTPPSGPASGKRRLHAAHDPGKEKMHVTTASLITIFRILLIPVYVTVAIYYGRTVREHVPDERLKIAAIIIFTVASLSDALDGWVARHFNQQSRLGAILDPLADKLLLLAVIGVLCFSDWPVHLPLWFVVIAVSREVLSIAGAFLVDHVAGTVKIQPHFTGKLSTPLQLLTMGCAMLEADKVMIPVAVLASFFAFTSGMIYIHEAWKQIQAAHH